MVRWMSLKPNKIINQPKVYMIRPTTRRLFKIIQYLVFTSKLFNILINKRNLLLIIDNQTLIIIIENDYQFYTKIKKKFKLYFFKNIFGASLQGKVAQIQCNIKDSYAYVLCNPPFKYI